MQIQAGAARNFQNVTRQNLTIGDDDDHVGTEGADLRDRFWIFDSSRLQERRARRSRPTNWRRFDTLLAADWLVLSSDNTDELMLG